MQVSVGGSVKGLKCTIKGYEYAPGHEPKTARFSWGEASQTFEIKKDERLTIKSLGKYCEGVKGCGAPPVPLIGPFINAGKDCPERYACYDRECEISLFCTSARKMETESATRTAHPTWTPTVVCMGHLSALVVFLALLVAVFLPYKMAFCEIIKEKSISYP